MGTNCSCFSNRIIYSDIQISEDHKIQTNYIIKANFPNYITSVIKIQAIFKGYIFRKKRKEPIKFLLSKTPSTNSFSIVEKTKITQKQLELLFNQYSPIKDCINIITIQVAFPNLAEYSGEWNPLTKERHGRGIQLWKDNSMYLGQWKNDKANGKGKMVLSSGEYYEGDFINDKAEGYGIYVHQNGCTYEGQWKNNLQNGNGKMRWPFKNEEYEGEFNFGKKHGNGKLLFNDGSVYIGQFVNDKIQGKGLKIWPDKRQYEGFFKNGRFDGEGEFKWPDGRVYKGHYIEDEKNGYGEFTWVNGKKYRGYWKNGKQHGKGELFSVHENTWKSGTWNEGKRVRWND